MYEGILRYKIVLETYHHREEFKKLIQYAIYSPCPGTVDPRDSDVREGLGLTPLQQSFCSTKFYGIGL
jgi:hypothetical protein